MPPTRYLTTKSPDDLRVCIEAVRRIEQAQKQELFNSAADFQLPHKCEFHYSLTLTNNSSFNLGKSNNLLFYFQDVEVVERINFDISPVLDSEGNNILHYAAFRHDISLINVVIKKVKLFGAYNVLNHRNKDGTNPLGMTFLCDSDNHSEKIKIATIFASEPEYLINAYLNNKAYMDYSTAKVIGGTNLLHNVILTAQKMKVTSEILELSKEYRLLSDLFEVLKERIYTSKNDGSDFRPDYPTMSTKIYMTKAKKLWNSDSASFISRDIEKIVDSLVINLIHSHKEKQSDDDSGDSEDEETNAYQYKQMLLNFHNFIKKSLCLGESPDQLSPTTNLHTYERNKNHTAELLDSFFEINEKTFENLNRPCDEITQEDYENYKGVVKNMVVPLFRGFPFMDSQYTSYQRKQVVEKIFQINKKLLNSFTFGGGIEESCLTEQEKVLIGIHSHTATASVGIQSLYELMVATKDDLSKLEHVENKLSQYFKRDSPPENFMSAMQRYVFYFKQSDSIRAFWELNNDGELPDKDVIKYKFPVVSTSKALDHPIRYAIGSNVESKVEGEEPMRPEYNANGYPAHRIAGLLYATLHKVSDLITQQKERTMIDVNQSVKNTDDDPDRSAYIRTQYECAFLGKLNSHSIIAVIPMVYPHVRSKEKLNLDFHQSVLGINMKADDETPIPLPEDFKSKTDVLSIMNTNISEFGKLMVPTMVNLADGMVMAVAKAKNVLPCLIHNNNVLGPYPVQFGEIGQEFSEAQKTLASEKYDNTDSESLRKTRLWEHVALKLKQEELKKGAENLENDSEECVMEKTW